MAEHYHHLAIDIRTAAGEQLPLEQIFQSDPKKEMFFLDEVISPKFKNIVIPVTGDMNLAFAILQRVEKPCNQRTLNLFRLMILS